MESENERRQADREGGALVERMTTFEKQLGDNESAIARHVTECAAIQRKVLVVCSLILGWVIAHSPETMHLLEFLEK